MEQQPPAAGVGGDMNEEEQLQEVLNALALDSSVPRNRLLRGVEVASLLRGGHEIMQPLKFDTYTAAEGEKLFDQSVPVSHFDDFLSHSWRTSPLQKAIALRILYNLRAATFSSCAVAALFFFLSRTGNGSDNALLPAMQPCHYSASVEDVVPLSAYCSATGMLTFIIMLLFAQDLVDMIAKLSHQRVRMVFFDKLSIHQTDPDLKPAGIRSLGGFLKLSHRFVILWHHGTSFVVICTPVVAIHL